GVHLTCVLSLDFEREAREAETKTVDVEHLYTHNKAFRNLTKSGVPSKRVVGVLSAAAVGFKLLSGVASQVDLSRVCVVGFSNMGNRKLVNPEWYLSHGVLREPLPREILPGDGGVFTFEKTHYATFGTAGVFTYAIENSGYQVAVMWDVPMIYGPSSNMFNVHIMEGVTANEQLFDLLRQDEKTVEVWNSGHWLSRNIHGFQVHGAMTNQGKASFLVQLIYNTTEPGTGRRLW
ncbi:bryoporin-like, partial [Mizuhopecten yessoensis]|uniref:bryoporin-like n=1 Tax=Mizuhopecten yessoensis TaxID=6573 RepID=UPI000B45AB37